MAGYPRQSNRFFIVIGLSLMTMILFACASTPQEVLPGVNNAQDAAEENQINLPQVPNDYPPTENWWRPSPGTSWQWQLSGDIDTSFDVGMYDIDLFDAPQAVIDQLQASGRIVICYFSAGSWEEWRPDANDFPAEVIGEPLEGWPGERWLDVRQVDILAPILEARLELARQKGCDGVELDNVDGYANETGFPLGGDDQVAFNTWLAQQAHARGLSVGLKNDLDQIEVLLPHFDWALNEQCFEYNECERLLPFIQSGKAVFGVEYNLEVDDFCPQANDMNLDWLKKSLVLDAYRVACR
jgi:hypothetical protein